MLILGRVLLNFVIDQVQGPLFEPPTASSQVALALKVHKIPLCALWFTSR